MAKKPTSSAKLNAERPLLAPSLRQWLADFANELDSGALRYEEGEGLVG